MRVALLVLVLGCGGIDYEDFAGEQRDATCGHYVRCGSFASVEDCRTYFERATASNASFYAAVDAGKIRYSADAAEDCIAALDTLDCDYAEQDADALTACDYVFTGTGRIGSPCAFDAECQTDRCVVPDCGQACCTGTCSEPRQYPGLDEPCTTVCAGDLYCGIDQICHAPAASGEPCNSFVVCAQPLYCSSSSSTCSVLPARGEPCTGSCAAEGLVCNSDATCADAAVAGDPCATENDCSNFYICNLDTRTCELPPAQIGLPNGQPCTFNTECMSRYCDALCMDQPICI